MVAAIIAIIVTVIILAIIAVVFFAVHNRRKSSQVKSARYSVKSINTVGVGSSPIKKKSAQGSDGIQVGSGSLSNPNVIERLRSRFVAMGALTAAIFGALGIRLYTMQVLTSEEYVEQAEQNTYTTVFTSAPRGYIYDANGTALVKNRTSLTVLADAEVADNRVVIQRLSALLGIPHNIVRQRIQDSTSGAQSQRVVASDVDLRNVAFISEHASAFPGISTESRTVREYPYGALAAHVLGYTGTISEEELATKKEGVSYEMGDVVGKSGVEASYDTVLAGDHGQRVVVADADGTVRQVVSETDPVKGNDLYLSIVAPIQYAADRALAALVAPNGIIGEGTGSAASLVCMDVTDGSIVAMANYPTYEPENFIGGISQEIWDLFNTEESYYPLLNRAIAGTYPAASTYKAFTSLAGLEYNFADTEREWDCQGTWTGFGTDYPQKCWQRSGHGYLGLRSGIVVSCDVVFYEIAKNFYEARDTIGETALQDFIKKFGFERKTGIDISGEAVGRVPTPAWKQEYFKDVPEEAGWLPGDMSNMVIGQGNVLITPIQLAVAYGGVATGKLIKPHLLKEVKNSEGTTVVSHQPEVIEELQINSEHLDIVRDALYGVATEDANVRSAFAEHGITSAGAKTGTGEVAGKRDYGMFACYAPYDNPKYVVTCIVEQGETGGLSACPPSAEVMGAALRYMEGTLDPSVISVAGSTGKSIEISVDDGYSRMD